jgi:HAD superfamily hydrolase (TIGR01509 family)
MQIKLIFFDYGNCLTKLSEGEWAAFANEFFSKRGADWRKQSEIWKVLKPLVNTGAMPLHEAQERIFNELGLGKKELLEWRDADLQFHFDNYHLFSGVKETLARLKAGGYALAILSDSVTASSIRLKIMQHQGIHDFFDADFQSCEIGAMKPEPRAYEIVLEHFRVKPSEAVFVGHEKEEIDGAKALGIKTIGFNVKDDSEPDAIANDFSEIPKIIAGFR